MTCEISKDLNGEISDKIHARIMRKMNHEQPMPADAITYLVCLEGFHWAYYGWGSGIRRDRWLTEAIRERCPDVIQEKAIEFVEKHGDLKKTFTNFIVAGENLDAFEKVKGWRKSSFQTLIIYGPTGRGKTHLAKAVQLEFLKDCMNTAFITSESLYENFINAQPSNDYDIDVHQTLADIRESALFILDDLGAERKTTGSFFEEQLKKIMDERHGRAIITTNLSNQELSSRYNEKIISRIMENSITVHLRGKDYRRAK